MTWSYLQPKNSLVVASPAPTPTTFSVTAGQGSRFQKGLATVSGYEATILTVVGDALTLASPLPFAPATNDEVVQSLLDQKDAVRMLIGDTDTTDQQLADEEISFLLGQNPNVYRAAAAACEALAGKFSRNVTYGIYQQITEDRSDQAKAYLELAKQMRFRAAKGGFAPYAGGYSITDKSGPATNTDRVAPFFTRDMETEPGTESATSDVPIRSPY